MGLLGGSFNPAHSGHRHISLNALARLGLDEVWWLVSPQNPLKPARGMASFAERLAGARATANHHPRIRVVDIEERFGTRFTVDTLAALQTRFPGLRLVWIAGADLLTQLPRWARWTEMFNRVPIAFFARPSYVLRAMAGKAARRFARYRIGSARGRALPDHPTPAWAFFPIRLHPVSASALRAARSAAGPQEDFGDT